MPEPVISVRDVSKAYRIWENPTSRLSSPLWQAASQFLPRSSRLGQNLLARSQAAYEDFYALQNVSFEIQRGESWGIIGRNGSGKSTLLQLIAGTLQPTSGSVQVRGKVAALLELGSGFNPDFTGRENVYLNATVLGLRREQIDARYEAIAAFAEIGEFINHPVQTYSSGMVMRLAFAVAVHVDPDILIVDEALSVGDARFQLKCARAIDRFVSQGVTLLFVSHDSSMVKRLCHSAVLLEKGRIVYDGRPNDVVNLYSKLIADGGSVEALASDVAALRATPASSLSSANAPAANDPAIAHDRSAVPQDASAEVKSLRLRIQALETLLNSHPDSAEMAKRAEDLLADERSHVQVSGQEFAYGGKAGRIHEVSVAGADGEARTWFSTGEPIVVKMIVEAQDYFPEPIFALTVKNTAGTEVYGTNTFFSNQPALEVKPGEWREVTFAFNLDLMPGHYFLSFGFTHFVGSELVVAHRRYDAIKLEIHGRDRTFGIANLKAAIRERAIAPP